MILFENFVEEKNEFNCNGSVGRSGHSTRDKTSLECKFREKSKPFLQRGLSGETWLLQLLSSHDTTRNFGQTSDCLEQLIKLDSTARKRAIVLANLMGLTLSDCVSKTHTHTQAQFFTIEKGLIYIFHDSSRWNFMLNRFRVARVCGLHGELSIQATDVSIACKTSDRLIDYHWWCACSSS